MLTLNPSRKIKVGRLCTHSLVRVSRRVEWGAHRPTPEHADAEARREARVADHDKAATPPLAQRRGATGSGTTGSHLSGAPFQGTWARSVAEDASPDYTNAKTPDFQAGLFPFAVTKGILDFGSSRAFDQTIDDLTRIEFTTACQDALASLARFWPTARGNTRRPASVRYPREDWGTTICDTQQTCLAVRLGAQLALKDSMVHGFCNSHQVSISPRSSSMRAEISAVESL
ncbi:hypothetical protein Bca101_101221 [Brassica carinata]